MANPILNDEALKKAAQAGWGMPDPATQAGRSTPIDDGPISTWRPGVMTVGGTATATGVLFILLLATATVGWMSIEPSDTGFPGLAIVGVLVGLACVIAC